MIRIALLRLGVVLLVGAIFPACSKKPVPVPEVSIADLKQTNGHLYQVGHSQPFSGIMTDNYENGALKSRSIISNGLMSGLSEGWHTNDQLEVRETFRNGVSDGIRTKWDASGSKVSEATISAGKINGSFRRWHPNGALAEEVAMTNDQPHGLARAWYPNGAPKAEVQMAHGAVVSQKRWHEEPSSDERDRNGKR